MFSYRNPVAFWALFPQSTTTLGSRTLATTPRSVPADMLATYAIGDDRMTGMSRYTSYGICALCGKRATKAGMPRHLKSCLAEHEPSRGEAARIFRLRIEDAYSPVYWMDVEMKARSTLEELDDFLRGMWLECCGHMSDFEIDGTTYTVPNPYGNGPFSMFADPEERDMKFKLGKVLN